MVVKRMISFFVPIDCHIDVYKRQEFDLLLTGDVEKEGEELLTEQMKRFYGNKTLDVLKAAHHGSGNSSAKEFLETVSPKYAVISAGVKNRYGHPHKEALRRLKESGSIIYSTQTGGCLLYTSRCV